MESRPDYRVGCAGVSRSFAIVVSLEGVRLPQRLAVSDFQLRSPSILLLYAMGRPGALRHGASDASRRLDARSRVGCLPHSCGTPLDNSAPLRSKLPEYQNIAMPSWGIARNP